MDPTVEAGIVGAGAAVLSSLLTSVLAIRITHLQVRSSERVARQSFLAEKQASTYVTVCEQVVRIEAWANVAVETARGRQSALERPEALTGDRWYALQGQLRVFGSRPARDEFDAMMNAAWILASLETAATQGKTAVPDDAVAHAVQEVRDHAAKLRTVVSAEVGPLRDQLDWRPLRFWQARYWRARRFQANTLRQTQGTSELAGSPRASHRRVTLPSSATLTSKDAGPLARTG